MLRQLLGIPLETADMEATDLEGTTGTEKSGTLVNTEKAESLTAKQKWMLLAAAAILLWFALQFVGLGAKSRKTHFWMVQCKHYKYKSYNQHYHTDNP